MGKVIKKVAGKAKEVMKEAVKSVTRSPRLIKLVAAVKNLNDVMKFEVPIPIEGMNEEALEAEIRGVFSEVKATDALETETWAILKDLGLPDPKGGKAAKEKPAKEEKAGKTEKAPKAAKTPKPKKEPGKPSNKQLVYKAWKAGTKDPEKLLKLVGGAVKANTVKSWLSAWTKGNNLPADQKK